MLNLEKGETIKLYCTAKGNPKPDITWYRDAVKIVTQGNKRVWDGNGYLLISNFDESMVGQYNCRAENVLGTTDSEQVKIDLTREKCKSFLES